MEAGKLFHVRTSTDVGGTTNDIGELLPMRNPGGFS